LSSLSTKPPSGTRDFLPDDIRRREYVVGVIRRVYEKYGYEPLETPAFENIETLLGKYGDEGNKLIFKILKRGEHEKSGEADLALRYDLTVPLARVVAQYQSELPKFFKRYQIQPVWRADRPARGRFREFYQCDIDAVGSTSLVVEIEQIAAMCEVFEQLGFSDVVISVNHRALLTSLLDASGVDGALHSDALIALDKLDKIGRDRAKQEMTTRGIDAGQAETILAACDDANEYDRLVSTEPKGAAARKDVAEILDALGRLGLGKYVRFNPRLARGLSYYTGTIIEAEVPDLAGSLAGGGRYDNLIGMFLGRDVPACGFTLGLERILVVMAERQMFPPGIERGDVDVLVTMWQEPELREAAIALARELRGGGLRVEVYPEADKLGRQFKYAADRGVPFVAVQGADERAKDAVTIKDLRSAEQRTLPRREAATVVGASLGNRID
jgi:histidyl-tRNA synthetase